MSDIKYRLSTMGIEAPPPQNPVLDSDQKALLLRVVIFGAFYPHYFSRKGERGEKVERDALRALCGLDPYSTVRLGGFPTEHLHKAYAHQLQQRVKEDIFGNSKRIISMYLKSFVCFLNAIGYRQCERCDMEPKCLFRR